MKKTHQGEGEGDRKEKEREREREREREGEVEFLVDNKNMVWVKYETKTILNTCPRQFGFYSESLEGVVSLYLLF